MNTTAREIQINTENVIEIETAHLFEHGDERPKILEKVVEDKALGTFAKVPFDKMNWAVISEVIVVVVMLLKNSRSNKRHASKHNWCENHIKRKKQLLHYC
jgi:hypothetical protein